MKYEILKAGIYTIVIWTCLLPLYHIFGLLTTFVGFLAGVGISFVLGLFIGILNAIYQEIVQLSKKQ